jgi:hypothetical protein
MFEQDRIYYRCICCGETGVPLTREHVFGKSFVKAVRENHRRRPWLHHPNGMRERPIKGSSWFGDITIKALCRDCNTNKLNSMMERSKPYLVDMYYGRQVTLQLDDARHLVRYFERIALLADVASSNLDLDRPQRLRADVLTENRRHRKSPPLLNEAIRAAWSSGDDIGFRVFAGIHDGVLGLNPAFNIARSLAPAMALPH